MIVEFILYVSDQEVSTDFYKKVLESEPTLFVPGMTEFDLPGCKLGLMPEKGIARILTPFTSHPEKGNGIPRCELYLKVADAEEAHKRAIAAGAREISEVLPRDWGDHVGYLADPDGHIIAFASPK